MAIRLNNRYPGYVNPADENYPYGSIKNESSVGAEDGTPLDQAWGNDLEGFSQALLTAAGITPSGTPDTAKSSQRLLAVEALISAAIDAAFEVRSLSESGYQAFPGGLLLQWGRVMTLSSGPVNFPFPIAFPNQPLLVTGSHNGNDNLPLYATFPNATQSGGVVNGWQSGGLRAGFLAGYLAVGY